MRGTIFVCVSRVCGVYFFFFKQKTAYEMRMCDWSSAVCSSDLASPRDNNEIIELEPGAPSGGDSPRIPRAQLVAVIRQRLDAMMGEIGRTLKDLHFVGPIGRQVVLVGGGADLKGIADYTQAALGRAARVGRPRGLQDRKSTRLNSSH